MPSLNNNADAGTMDSNGANQHDLCGAGLAGALVLRFRIDTAWPGATAFDLVSFPSGTNRPANTGLDVQINGSKSLRLFFNSGGSVAWTVSGTWNLGDVVTVVFTRDGTVDNLTNFDCYHNGVLQSRTGTGLALTGGTMGWMSCLNRYEHQRPGTNITMLEASVVGRACTAQEAIDVMTKDARDVFGADLKRSVRFDGNNPHDVVQGTCPDTTSTTLDLNTASGTPTNAEVFLQQHTNAVAYFRRSNGNLRVLSQPGALHLSPPEPLKRLTCGAINGRFQFGEPVKLGTFGAARGFFMGHVQHNTTTTYVVIYDPSGTWTTGTITGQWSGATATSTAVVDACRLRGTLKQCAASGGSGSFSFWQVVTVTDGVNTGTGNFVAESGGNVFLADPLGTFPATSTTVSASGVTRTGGAVADFVPTCTGQASGVTLSGTPGTLATITLAAGSDFSHAPTAAALPAWWSAIAAGMPTLRRLFVASDKVGVVGGRVFSQADLAGSMKHRVPQSFNSMPGRVRDVGRIADYIAYENGRRGVTSNRLDPATSATDITRNSFTVFGVLWCRSSHSGTYLCQVAGQRLERDANGRVQANINGGTVTLTRADGKGIYWQGRPVPYTWTVASDGTTRLQIGLNEVATGVHALTAGTGGLDFTGANTGTISDGSYQSEMAFGVSDAMTPAQCSTVISAMAAAFTVGNAVVPATCGPDLLTTFGGSSPSGVVGYMIAAGQIGQGGNVTFELELLKVGALRNSVRVFNAATFGAQFTTNSPVIHPTQTTLFSTYVSAYGGGVTVAIVPTAGSNDASAGKGLLGSNVINAEEQTTYAAIAGIAPGVRIIPGEIHPRDSGYGNFNADRVAFNGRTAQSATAWGIVRITLLGAFDADGDQGSETYYSGDRIHLQPAGVREQVGIVTTLGSFANLVYLAGTAEDLWSAERDRGRVADLARKRA